MSSRLHPKGTQRAAIDWGAVHKRLEISRKRLAEGEVRGPEETRSILRARAQALAREPLSMQKSEEGIELIEFVLAYERYAVESAYVREVYPLKELTPLPCTPRYVAGIINLRGQILPVLDIKKFFDLPQKGLPDLSKVIVLRSDSMQFGILADVIVGTRTIAASALQASLPTLTGVREEYLRGVTPDRAVILDASRLLSDDKLIVHEEVGT